MTEEFAAWKQHFINQARGKIPHQNRFYKVREQKGGGNGGGEANIKLITPTQQVVERAKSTLSDPPVVYDPVTGITNQPMNKSIKTTKRKKQSCNCKNKKRKTEKKKKIVKKKPQKTMKGGGKKKVNKKSGKKKWYENI
jgi:hypothetical protein